MIISKLIGGLGNQMFQYALGRHLAIKYNTPLKLDVFDLLNRFPRNKNFVYRDYALDIFNIHADFASLAEVNEFTVARNNNKYIYHIKKIFKKPKNVVKQKKGGVDERILRIGNHCYLDGYWQSEMYFLDIEKIIRQDFIFNFRLSYEAAKMAEKIKSTKSICLNVRRCDFENNPIHGMCNLNYFQQAIEYILERHKNVHFYVFSDDLEWCKKNMRIKAPSTFVSHDIAGDKFKLDFNLMTLCKHYIISNSTFAWWGAWLNPNQDKIVITPIKWFNTSVDTNDLIPEKWIRM